MRGTIVLLLFCQLQLALQAQEGGDAQETCGPLLKEEQLPVKLATRGRPRRARWEEVDEVLTRLEKAAAGRSCRFTFGQIFEAGRQEDFLPVTNTLLRVVPESSLGGVSVHSSNGDLLGRYESRSVYTRRGGLYASDSYTLYYFQFRDADGELQSSGTQLLLDNFLMPWEDVKDKQAFGGAAADD